MTRLTRETGLPRSRWRTVGLVTGDGLGQCRVSCFTGGARNLFFAGSNRFGLRGTAFAFACVQQPAIFRLVAIKTFDSRRGSLAGSSYSSLFLCLGFIVDLLLFHFYAWTR
jgi:hypothetical protein